MPYNSIVSRTDVAALIPEEVSNEMLTGMTNESASLTLFRRIPISRNQTRFPVLSALPTAYFVNGDTGLKQTTEAAWANKYMNVEELAAIVPIPEAVLDDSSFDVWGSIRPLLEQAIARALDAAIFFGTNKPSSWPDAIVTDATDAANIETRGTLTAANGGLAGDLSVLFSEIESDGYDVTGIVANTRYKGLLRQVRATTGERLMEVDLANNRVDGIDIRFPMRGLWPAGAGVAELIAGDFSQAIIGVRQDFTYKVLDQAVIQDNTGAIQYNLAQQDMVALRVVFRVAFQVSNPINYDQPTEGSRYPFGVMLSA